MSKRKQNLKSKKFYFKASTSFTIFIIILLALASVMFTKSAKFESRQQKKESQDSIDFISRSPSGKYLLRLGSPDKLELVTPNRPEQIDLSQGTQLESIAPKNVIWSKNEKLVVITYIAQSGDPSTRTARMLILNNSGDIINDVEIGKGSFYGNNEENAFPPVFSFDDEFIGVQTDLIHAFAIYSWDGNFIAKLPTVFASIQLFSDSMYSLENGAYSPFLDYRWSSTTKSIIYKFPDSKLTHETKAILHNVKR